MGESSFHEWCAGAWADRRRSAGVKWLICVFASWSACFLPIWHRSCLEVGGEGVELCSEACSTGRLEEKHFACSGPCPLCCALSSGVGGWQCYSPGAEGPASSTAKRCSCVSPPPPVLFVRHWKTHISPEVYQKGGLVLLGHVGGAVLGSGRGKDVHVLPPCPSAGLPAGSRGWWSCSLPPHVLLLGVVGGNRGCVLLRAWWDAGYIPSLVKVGTCNRKSQLLETSVSLLGFVVWSMRNTEGNIPLSLEKRARTCCCPALCPPCQNPRCTLQVRTGWKGVWSLFQATFAWTYWYHIHT